MNTSKDISLHRFHGNVALSFEGNNRTVYISQEQAAWLRDKLQAAVADIEHHSFERSRFDTCTYLTTGQKLLRTHITEKIERGEAEAVVGNPAIPQTDNQKHQAYLDWVNSFGTLAGFAGHYGLNEEQARKLIDEGREIHNASVRPKKFTVITVSSNANSFGYMGVLVLAEDGTGYECLYQAYGVDPVPARGDTLPEDKVPTYCRRTLPATAPTKAAKLIAEATKSNRK